MTTTTPQRHVELRRVRDFGGTINVVFEFLRQNWKAFGKSIIYLVGPVILVAALAGGYYIRTTFSALEMAESGDVPDPLGFGMELGGAALLSLLGSLLTIIMMAAVVSSYVRVYRDREVGTVEVDDVWRETRRNLGRAFVGSLMPLLLLAVLGAALVGLAAVTSPIAVAIVALPVMVFGVYLYIAWTIVIPMMIEERIGFFTAARRSMRLMEGRWWFSFWIYFMMGIIMMFASLIFQIPYLVVVQTTVMSGAEDLGASSSGFALAAAVASVGYYLVVSIYILTTVVLYFNLVERKEGIGMSDRINQIGATSDDAATAAH